MGHIVKQFSFFALLFLVVLAARSLYTMPIEYGGDALKKWRYASNFDGRGAALLVDHHTMRWAVNLVGVVTHRTFGDWPSSYYIAPLAMYALMFTVLFGIATTAMPRWMLLPFAVCLFVEPMMFRASTQFQPIVFGAAYVALSYACLAKWLKTERLLFFVLSILFIFLAYGSKIPYGYFLPGLLLFLWSKKGILPVVSYVLFFAVLLGTEIFVFNLASDRFLLLGRASALVDTHTPGGGAWRFEYMDYFTMWKRMSWYNLLLAGTALLLSITFAVSRSDRKAPDALVAITWMSVSYVIINMTLIVNFESMLTPQGPMIKYLAVVTPFICFAACGWTAFFVDMARSEQFARVARVAVCSFAALLAFQHLHQGIAPSYAYNRLVYPKRHMFCYRVNDHYQKMAAWLEKGNCIYTKRPALARGLAVLTRPFVGKDRVVFYRMKTGKFVVHLKRVSRDEIQEAGWYNFSQFKPQKRLQKHVHEPRRRPKRLPTDQNEPGGQQVALSVASARNN